MFTLIMQVDANLTVNDMGGNATFTSDIVTLNSGDDLMVRFGGNLVLCTKEGRVLRESCTSGIVGEELRMQDDATSSCSGTPA